MANLGPQIQSLSPNIGSQTGGTSVVITGVNFQDGIGSVQFGSVAAPNFTVNSDTQITAVSPVQGVGNVSVGILSPGDSTIYGMTATFTYTQGLPISNTLTQVSCGSATNIWGVDAAGNVFQYNGSSRTPIPGGLKQVSVAADGTVWGINAVGNVYSYRGSQANSWAQPAGVLSQVAVGSTSLVYGVNAAGVVYQYRGSQANSWAQVGTGMKQVSVCVDGPVWGVNPSGAVYKYAGNNAWTQIQTNVVAGGPNIPFTQLSTPSSNVVFGLDAQGNIYEYVGVTGYPWQKIGLPPAQSFSYAVDTSCVLIDLQGITQFFPGSNRQQ